MKGECPQSCAACSQHDGHPFLGAPVLTCKDLEHPVECANLKSIDACTTQRPYMQEACRSTCQICNASKDAFPDGREPERDDTAAHSCPDGSDLGGGEVLVRSEDPKQIASEVDGGDAAVDADHPKSQGQRELQPSQDEEHDVEVLPSTPTKASLNAAGPARRHVGGFAARSDSALLDPALPSWPFLVVNGLLLLLLGYLLRGFVDARSRRRRQQQQSGAVGSGRGEEARVWGGRTRDGKRASDSYRLPP